MFGNNQVAKVRGLLGIKKLPLRRDLIQAKKCARVWSIGTFERLPAIRLQ
jgi:hypothetical protein